MPTFNDLRALYQVAQKVQDQNKEIADLAISALANSGLELANQRANNIRRYFAACEMAWQKVETALDSADFEGLYDALNAHDKAIYALQDRLKLAKEYLQSKR